MNSGVVITVGCSPYTGVIRVGPSKTNVHSSRTLQYSTDLKYSCFYINNHFIPLSKCLLSSQRLLNCFFVFFKKKFNLAFDLCRFCVVIHFFIPTTPANDLRLRRISIPDLIHYIIFLS